MMAFTSSARGASSLDGTLLVRSDNAAYEPIKVKPDELNILGRVIWIGGKP
jgi:phage repressor protein C with HTH and peptisase S24 domain